MHPDATPIESLKKVSPIEYAAAPTWHDTGATPLPTDATVRVALSRS
jgi:hypothetical protein